MKPNLSNESSYSFVYPSWATLSYTWSDLESMFSNPLHCGYLNPDENWEAIGYTLDPPIYELRSSPLGGGIISIEPCSPQKPLVRAALMSKTHFCIPVGPNHDGMKPPTLFLEPMDGELSAFPSAPKHLRTKHKSYTCLTSVENCSGLSIDVCYFLLKKWSMSPFIQKITEASDSMDLPMRFLSQGAVPSNIVELTKHELQKDEALSAVFFELDAGSQDLHMKYAALVYFAYYITSVSKRKLVRAALYIDA